MTKPLKNPIKSAKIALSIKEKSPDTTPGSFTNALGLFRWSTTSNKDSIHRIGFSACHQCWGQAVNGALGLFKSSGHPPRLFAAWCHVEID
jgi:hypothetical protein